MGLGKCLYVSFSLDVLASDVRNCVDNVEVLTYKRKCHRMPTYLDHKVHRLHPNYLKECKIYPPRVQSVMLSTLDSIFT